MEQYCGARLASPAAATRVHITKQRALSSVTLFPKPIKRAAISVYRMKVENYLDYRWHDITAIVISTSTYPLHYQAPARVWLVE
jgi:hypothetical protein